MDVQPIKRYRYLPLRAIYRQYTSSKSKELTKDNSQTSEQSLHGSYKALLFDPRWKAKRLLILERDHSCCIICKSNTSLQVHHRQYHFMNQNNAFKPPWDYDDILLITLCERCHQKGHRQYKVPTISI